MGSSLTVERATTAAILEAYVEKVLAPTLRPGQIMVMDNLWARKGACVRELIEERGAKLLCLPRPTPQISDLIEEAFSKMKGIVRKAEPEAERH